MKSTKKALATRSTYVALYEVVRTMMDGHLPQVWVSDRYSTQQKHGNQHQTCLVHLARDTAFANEHGDDNVPLRLKLWFGRVFALAAGIATFAASTIAAKRKALERELEAILATPTTCDLGKALQAKIRRARHQLLTFAHSPARSRRPTMAVSAACSAKSPMAIAPCGPLKPKPPCAQPSIPQGWSAQIPSKPSSRHSPDHSGMPPKHRLGNYSHGAQTQSRGLCSPIHPVTGSNQS